MTYDKRMQHRAPGRPGAGSPDAIAVPGKSTLVQQLAVQRKEVGRSTTADAHASARAGVAGSAASLPFLATIQRAFGAHDVTHVQAHTDAAAQDASVELGAKAYAYGDHVAFGEAPDLHTAAHEAAHVVQQRQGVSLKGGVGEVGDVYERHADAVADLVVAGKSAEDLLGELAPAPHAASMQRKEINPDGEYDRMTDAAAHLTVRDWLKDDRINNTPRWQEACRTNLLAGDSSQYKQIVERRDFYLWFYNAACAAGFETRWMLAAYLVANGAHQVADFDADGAQRMVNLMSGSAPVGLQAAMRQGNQMIFDNVFPKLKRLWLGGKLTGQAALNWDMQTLAEEQALVQPMYNALGPNRTALDYIAHQSGLWMGLGIAFTDAEVVAPGPYNKGGSMIGLPADADISQPINRWRYGMTLGNTFAPKPTGYTDATAMPAVGADYQMNNGTNAAYAAVNTRQSLHAFDAYVNPSYAGERTNGMGTAHAYLDSIIAGLSEREKQEILADRMPDGNRYSTAMGQLGGVVLAYGILVEYGVSDEQAARLMPNGADPAAIGAFMTNFKAVRGQHMYYGQVSGVGG